MGGQKVGAAHVGGRDRGPARRCDVVQQEEQRGVCTRFRTNEPRSPSLSDGAGRGSVRVTPRTGCPGGRMPAWPPGREGA